MQAQPEQVAHSNRFRQVSNRYPRRVAEAYAGDLRRAMADSDEQVAAKVAAWERAQGLTPVEWVAIGREEREEAPKTDMSAEGDDGQVYGG